MKHLDRRKFLSQSAFLAAAAGMAPPLGGLSAQEKADREKKGPANDRLRVAVIGVNGRGMDHVRGFAGNHNCVVTPICDADRNVIGPAMRYVEQTQGRPPRFEQDIRKVVADNEVDIISIATPNHWHSLAAIWGMQNGKDVYVEKPVSHNVSEGRRTVEAARRLRKICQAGTQSRSTRGMRAAMAFLKEGRIGRIHRAYAYCYKLRGSIGQVNGPQQPREGLNYDLWCGPASNALPRRRNLHYDWHWIWEYGNGDLGNQGIHEMDKARWGLDKNTLPRAVQSVGGRFGYTDDGETPNTQIVWFDYGNQELIFEVRGLASDSPYPGSRSPRRGARPSAFVGNLWIGTEGFLVCPSYTGGIAYTNDGEVIQEFTGGGDHYGNFVRAVRSRKAEELNADIEEGHLSSAMCHLGNISYRLGTMANFRERPNPFGRPNADAAMRSMVSHMREHRLDTQDMQYKLGPRLTLNTMTETFVNNRDADALLTRQYRRGFEVPARI